MKINCLQRHSAQSIKALFGLPPKVLAEVLFLTLPELENQRTERLKQRPTRKRRFHHRDGRPREVKPFQKVLMCLLYLRHNTSHEVVGRMFARSADTSENAFVEVLPIIKRVFPQQKWAAETRHGRAAGKWRPSQVERVIVDSFETPVPRPSNHERQKRLYSGKKKRHTLKTQIYTDQDGGILSVGKAYRGPKADIKIYEEEPIAELLTEQPRLGDKAYADRKHPEIETPMKKPKGKELNAEQKAANKEVSKKRVRVEHGIRRVKGWRVVRDEYRMPLGLFTSVSSAVVGLVQFATIVG
ncbi:MAG: transposase [Acidobacteria bacterium]|nr:transposase [Acidobacteriota bacterium]